MDNNNYYNSRQNQRSGLSTGSMIAGILSIVLGYSTGFFGMFAGITAIVLGIFSRQKGQKMSGKAIAGIITGAVGLIMGTVIVTLSIMMIKANGISDILEQYQDLIDFYNR